MSAAHRVFVTVCVPLGVEHAADPIWGGVMQS